MPRILIVENQLLLGAGLQAFLASEIDLDLIGVSPRNQVELVQQIRRIKPDIVFLNEDSGLVDAGELLILLQDFPKLRVVVINSDDYLVRIYDKQKVLMPSATQLINIIYDNQTTFS